MGCDNDKQSSSAVSVYVPSPPSKTKNQKRKRRPTAAPTKSQRSRPVVDARINKTAVLPTVELSNIVTHKEEHSNAEVLYCSCKKPYYEIPSTIVCDKPN